MDLDWVPQEADGLLHICQKGVLHRVRCRRSRHAGAHGPPGSEHEAGCQTKGADKATGRRGILGVFSKEVDLLLSSGIGPLMTLNKLRVKYNPGANPTREAMSLFQQLPSHKLLRNRGKTLRIATARQQERSSGGAHRVPVCRVLVRALSAVPQSGTTEPHPDEDSDEESTDEDQPLTVGLPAHRWMIPTDSWLLTADC